ncbi:unnamed protein product, partial [Phaeothamnion confervicola]
GDAIEANFKGKGRWFKGKVKAVHRNGTVDVRYDDGDSEDRVEPQNVRRLHGGGGGGGSGKRDGDDNGKGTSATRRGAALKVGDAIEANFKGKGRWFKGKVKATHVDGTVDIRYDDGDSEERVDPANVRRQDEGSGEAAKRDGGSGGGSTGSAPAVGNAVEVNFKGKGRWFKGKITATHRDGTVDVCYDDGDLEDRVEPHNVRPLDGGDGVGSGGGSGGGSGLAVGDAMEANFKGEGSWFKGTIRAAHRDGTFDVRYDDGDTEERIDPLNVRSVDGAGSKRNGGAAGRSGSPRSGAGRRMDVGDLVEVNFKGEGRWFEGKMTAKHQDGTIDVRYDDGDTEERIAPANVRRLDGGGSAAAKLGSPAGGRRPFLDIGDAVEANFKGKGRWLKGKVKVVHRDGTVNVRYDDGDTEECIEPHNIRLAGCGGSGSKEDGGRSGSGTATGRKPSLDVGDAVEANFKGKGRWFKGKVRLLHRDGTIDVRYDDGDTEECVEPANVRQLESGGSGGKEGGGRNGGDNPISGSRKPLFNVGDAVEANFKGKGRWFKGKVRLLHRDGTIDVRYDDGDTEERIEPANVRQFDGSGGGGTGDRGRSAGDSPTGGSRKPSFEVGDAVEANFKGKGRWFRGKVKAIKQDGTIDVRYDDGDTEEHIKPANVRRLDGGGSDAAAKPGSPAGSRRVSLDIGDTVEVNLKGKGRWFKGKIRAVHRDGTVDVRYEDGDTEEAIDPRNVRQLDGGGSRGGAATGRKASSAKRGVEIGDAVEANFKGKGRWFKGKVEAIHRDGTFDVRYDDGDNEERIEPAKVRQLGGSGGAAIKPGSPDGSRKTAVDIGDAVEANFKGKGRWFKGKIRAVHRDGTVDVRYDDGDTEDAVDPRNVRRLDDSIAAGGKKPTGGSEIGDAVEANFKGKGRWFKGKVKTVHRDGTMDVRYDDGDTEEGVAPRNVRPLDGAQREKREDPEPGGNGRRSGGSGGGGADIADAVEVNFKGKGRWFKGKVTLKHRDGTVNVRYDDGDTEDHVEPHNVRLADGGRSGADAGGGASASPAVIRTGDAVEANFKGKGRWFRGTVEAAHRDGTYHVRYGDGDEEDFVEKANIRLRNVKSANGGGAPQNVRLLGGGAASPAKNADGGGVGVGDAVEANFKGKGRWFKGKVKAIHRNGTVDVRYDDGDFEEGIESHNVRLAGGGGGGSGSKEDGARAVGSPGRGTVMGIGDAVEANFKSKGRWFKGKVKMIHRDGNIDVRYDDGDTEERIDPRNVRQLDGGGGDRSKEDRGRGGGGGGSPTSGSRKALFDIGNAVEANFKGKGRWFKGKVQMVHRDGTIDVRYDDGDTEERIDPCSIRALDGSPGGGSGADGRGLKIVTDRPAGSRDAPLDIGDAVEANFKSKGRWFKGKVEMIHHDGTIDIRYDDGDTEERIESHNVRRTSGDNGGGGGARDAAANSRYRAHGIDVGDAVDANFKSKGRWFKGTVKAVHRNGTVDVRYDDGDSEDSI